MSTNTIARNYSSAVKLAVVDLLLLAAAYLIPVVSHIISYPLHMFDPMRVILFTGLLLTANKKNAYVMAVTLPLFAFLVSGHPVFPKNMAIIAELVANVAIFSFLEGKIKHQGAAIFASILLSKVLYYGIKFALISAGLLATSLVDTNIMMQLGVAAVIALAFTLKK